MTANGFCVSCAAAEEMSGGLAEREGMKDKNCREITDIDMRCENAVR